MNKIDKILVSIFFIIILLIVPNIQATEFRVIKNSIEEQIEKNLFYDEIINTIDIWDLLEFLHFLLITLMNFLINFIRIVAQKIVMLLFSPFILVYYIVWLILMIMFPH